MVNILVCGGRDFTDYNLLSKTLNFIYQERGWYHDEEYLTPDVRIISGAAEGADTLAIDWAVVNWCLFKEYPADWSKYKKKAGPIRNQQMLDEETIQLVVAFPTDKSVGTWDMVRRAKKAGIEVIIVN